MRSLDCGFCKIGPRYRTSGEWKKKDAYNCEYGSFKHWCLKNWGMA